MKVTKIVYSIELQAEELRLLFEGLQFAIESKRSRGINYSSTENLKKCLEKIYIEAQKN